MEKILPTDESEEIESWAAPEDPDEQDADPALEVEPTVTIPLDHAVMLWTLYNHIEAADAHYRNCQCTQFREHIKSTYLAANVEAAYENLKSLIEIHKI